MDKPEVVSAEKAAQILGISESSVRRRIKDGSLKAIKLGGRVLIPVHGIHNILGKPSVEW